MKYCVTTGDGGDGVEIIEADNLCEAREKAERWARAGDWDSATGDGGCTIIVRVWDAAYDWYDDAEEADADYSADEIAILPPEPECDNGTHDWTREFSGGCDENPGVWDIGNGRMKYVSRCRNCGMECVRIESYTRDTYETVSYGDPDPEWVEAHVD